MNRFEGFTAEEQRRIRTISTHDDLWQYWDERQPHIVGMLLEKDWAEPKRPDILASIITIEPVPGPQEALANTNEVAAS
jgi:hypothetical protein